MVKLSMIIPYYKTFEETSRLMQELKKQINDEVEIIIVEDNNDFKIDIFDFAKIIHHDVNLGVSWARNKGIKESKGEYITFIDSDDMVAPNYVSSILNKINTTDFDFCYFSWKHLNGFFDVIIEDNPPDWNWAVWNAVYKKDYVELFDENLRYKEDVPWQIKMRAKNGKKTIINEILYYYNNGRSFSLSDTYLKGGN